MQKHIADAWDGSTATVTRTTEQWKAEQEKENAPEAKEAEVLKGQLHVTVEEKTIAGVHVYRVTPANIPEQNRNRLLVHVHGGGYVFFGGMAATGEAILMAHYAQTEVISVDYRMPPDFPFPAAIDDTVAVWKEVIKSHTPRNVGSLWHLNRWRDDPGHRHPVERAGPALAWSPDGWNPLVGSDQDRRQLLHQ